MICEKIYIACCALVSYLRQSFHKTANTLQSLLWQDLSIIALYLSWSQLAPIEVCIMSWKRVKTSSVTTRTCTLKRVLALRGKPWARNIGKTTYHRGGLSKADRVHGCLPFWSPKDYILSLKNFSSFGRNVPWLLSRLWYLLLKYRLPRYYSLRAW